MQPPIEKLPDYPTEIEASSPRYGSVGVQLFYLGMHGGTYWIRTSDPSDVNTVLYQLS